MGPPWGSNPREAQMSEIVGVVIDVVQVVLAWLVYRQATKDKD
jgi:hypothetical protein